MAWTESLTKKYQRNTGRYASDLSEDEWKIRTVSDTDQAAWSTTPDGHALGCQRLALHDGSGVSVADAANKACAYAKRMKYNN